VEVPSWSVYVAGETLALFLGIIIFLVYRLIKTEHNWTEKLIKANQKIHQLKKLEHRYQLIKENLHRYMEMVEDLKKQLEVEKNNPTLTNKITRLEIEIGNEENKLLIARKEFSEEQTSTVNISNEKIDGLQNKIIVLEADNQKLQAAVEFSNDNKIQHTTIVEISNDAAPAVATSNNDGIDLWGEDEPSNDNNDGIDLWGDEPQARTPAPASAENTHEFDTTYGKNKKELERLRNSNKDQRTLIYELRMQMAADGSNGGDTGPLDQLEKMLKESETIVTMLEEELTNVQDQMNAYEQNLDAAESSIQNMNDMKNAATPEEESAEIKQLMSQLDGANQMAMTMMQANGDQSNVISFARNSTDQHTLEDLSDAILATVKSYSLKGAIQFRGRAATINISSEGRAKATEIIHLSDMSNNDRYEESGDELLIRFEKISLFISNMPSKDPDLASRYKDTLAMVCELACITGENIEAASAMEQQQAVLKKVIGTTHKTIKDVEEQFVDQASQSKEIVSSMSSILDSPAFVNAMDPMYRDIYKNIMKETKQRFDILHKESSVVDKSFTTIIDSLQKKIN